MGLPYANIYYAAADVTAFQGTIDAAAALANSAQRALVIIPRNPPGQPWGPITLFTRDYVDIRGDPLSSSHPNPDDTWLYSNLGPAPPPGDVIWQSGTDSIVAHLRLEHRASGAVVKYAMHVDSASAHPPVDMVVVNCHMTSEDKAAIGIGMQPGQRLFVYDNKFSCPNVGINHTGLVCHNYSQVAETAPTTAVFDNNTLDNNAPGSIGVGLSATLYNTTQNDLFIWKGGHCYGNGVQVDVDISDGSGNATPNGTWYIDPAAYRTSRLDATVTPIQWPYPSALPTPARMPRRYA